jgi:hypothetical protein
MAIDPLETDWLHMVEGDKGDVFGAGVTNIQQGEENISVDIIIPQNNVDNYLDNYLDNYKGVTVIDKKTGDPIEQQQAAEQLFNDEKDAYGIRLHLKRLPSTEVKLQFFENSD